MATLSLEIPRAFGKTFLAEQIQTFVGQAMRVAWDACVNEMHEHGCISSSEAAYYLKRNPYKTEE